MFAFVVFKLRLAGKNVPEMTYFVSGETSVISQSSDVNKQTFYIAPESNK